MKFQENKETLIWERNKKPSKRFVRNKWVQRPKNLMLCYYYNIYQYGALKLKNKSKESNQYFRVLFDLKEEYVG